MADASCLAFYGQKTEQMKGLGYYSDLDRFDIIERLRPLFARGWKIDTHTNKISMGSEGLSWNSPWWHQKTSADKDCGMWHQVMFNHFGFIPRGCQECWKVVVRPRTLKELFALRELEKRLDRPSKCGIEVRSYTPAHYGGYFYNNSLDQGRECYKVVRDAVSEAISPDMGVILKRACTEMELYAGPSPFWRITPENVELEQYIMHRVAFESPVDVGQPDFLLNHLFKRWILWAFSHNDLTYLEYTGGKPLYAPPVLYHEHDLEEIKKDLRTARLVGSGINEDKALQVRETLDEAMKNLGLTPQQLGAGAGFTDLNPLYIGEEDMGITIGGE